MAVELTVNPLFIVGEVNVPLFIVGEVNVLLIRVCVASFVTMTCGLWLNEDP